METFKIKVTESTEREVEVKLPLFRRNEVNVYKVFSNKKCIGVTYSEVLDPCIQVYNSDMAFHLSGTKDCSEQEFLEEYNKVSIRLEELALGM